jgi:hypothetical protein
LKGRHWRPLSILLLAIHMRHTGRLHSYIRGIHSQEVPGPMAAVNESDSTSNHGQTLTIDNHPSLQCSVETKDIPSSQFFPCVSNPTGGDIQPCQNSKNLSKNCNKSGGNDSESFSARDRYL